MNLPSQPATAHSSPTAELAADTVNLTPTYTAAEMAELDLNKLLSESSLPPPARYTVIEVLGSGANGVVFKAMDRVLMRPVALKILKKEFVDDSASYERFLREARVTAELTHPNIAGLYDIGIFTGRLFVTLELVEGGNLAKLIDGRPMPAGQAAAILLPVVEAVQFAHCHNLLHRDIKPANILLEPNGTPKLTDFGFARRIGAPSNLTQAIVGTVAYMSKEQAEWKQGGPELDCRADIYSLGATLYEMVTGEPLLGKGDVGLTDALDRIRSADEWDPPSRLRPDLAPDVDTICRKCLRKKRHERYPKADALIEDLRRYLNPPVAQSTI